MKPHTDAALRALHEKADHSGLFADRRDYFIGWLESVVRDCKGVAAEQAGLSLEEFRDALREADTPRKRVIVDLMLNVMQRVGIVQDCLRRGKSKPSPLKAARDAAYREQVRALVRDGLNAKEAIAEVAKQPGASVQKVRRAYYCVSIAK